MPERRDKPREFQQICGAETALTSGQHDVGVLRRKIGPPSWNLVLAAFLVEKGNPVLAAVFLPSEGFKLLTAERVKGMGDAKLCAAIRRKGVPWGISESACVSGGCEYGYGAFGIPELAMKQLDTKTLVISPYSTFLALLADPAAAVRNLRCMADFGWSGRYGFFEAVDYSKAGGEAIRSWMAHHQGMSLLAACNLLFDCPFPRYFQSEPRVMATELLLHERIPAGVEAEAEVMTEAAAFA